MVFHPSPPTHNYATLTHHGFTIHILPTSQLSFIFTPAIHRAISVNLRRTYALFSAPSTAQRHVAPICEASVRRAAPLPRPRTFDATMTACSSFRPFTGSPPFLLARHYLRLHTFNFQDASGIQHKSKIGHCHDSPIPHIYVHNNIMKRLENSIIRALETFHDLDTKHALANLFALGLYLRQQDLTLPGYKACENALNALRFKNTLKSEILDQLDSNRYDLAVCFKPSREILNLIKTGEDSSAKPSSQL